MEWLGESGDPHRRLEAMPSLRPGFAERAPQHFRVELCGHVELHGLLAIAARFVVARRVQIALEPLVPRRGGSGFEGGVEVAVGDGEPRQRAARFRAYLKAKPDGAFAADSEEDDEEHATETRQKNARERLRHNGRQRAGGR
jgi:hypothetical protein